jgi:hypothetical protein
LITLTRNLARKIRSIFRRALNVTPRGLTYPVTFQAGPDGLCVRAQSPDAAVEYYAPGVLPVEQITVPLEALADCEGRKDEPVELEAADNEQVVVRWRDRTVPQLVQYAAAEPLDAAKFPPLPAQLAENPPGLVKALEDACETTDPDSLRFALGCVQVRGASGCVVATDGRQLLVQGGFSFPWQDDVLLVRSKLWACPELPQDQPVRVGREESRMVFQIGPWTAWLPTNPEGRFPEMVHHVPSAEAALARCQLSGDDAAFLLQSLPKLPADEELNGPVTLDLNGSIAVRARAAGQSSPTELVLRNSAWSGEPVRINTNRRFLARAVSLGFRELLLFGPKPPAACQEANCRYVWALLDPESAIRPTESPIRLESPLTQSTKSPQSPRRIPLPPKKNDKSATADCQAPGPTTPPDAKEPAAAIEQAVALRSLLQNAAHQAGELIRTLQQDRKQSRQLRTALASLRQLQSLDV